MEPSAVLEAAGRLKGVAHHTPVLTSRTLDARTSGRLFFKSEHLQRTGAFKFRGAYHALEQLSGAARARGVVTWSSGNHAAALALAGRLLDVKVTVVMPKQALAVKRAAVQGYGAEIFECPAERREEIGQQLARERRLTPIPPYDHEHVIAGQGTAALELLADAGPLDLLLAPVGGGGLLAGTALAAGASPRTQRPRVVGVEPERADDAARSLRSGSIVVLPTAPDTIADGLRTRFVGTHNFDVLRERVEDIVTVTEEQILDAMLWLWTRMKQVVEPSGAVALAAVMAGRIDAAGKRVGILLSGGNADPAWAAAALATRNTMQA